MHIALYLVFVVAVVLAFTPLVLAFRCLSWLLRGSLTVGRVVTSSLVRLSSTAVMGLLLQTRLAGAWIVRSFLILWVFLQQDMARTRVAQSLFDVFHLQDLPSLFDSWGLSTLYISTQCNIMFRAASYSLLYKASLSLLQFFRR